MLLNDDYAFLRYCSRAWMISSGSLSHKRLENVKNILLYTLAKLPKDDGMSSNCNAKKRREATGYYICRWVTLNE